MQARARQAQQRLIGPVFGSREWQRRAKEPVSDAVLNPKPEPVVPARQDQLEPLFAHLRTAEVGPCGGSNHGSVLPASQPAYRPARLNDT